MDINLNYEEKGNFKATKNLSVSAYPWKLGKCCLLGQAAYSNQTLFDLDFNSALEDCSQLYYIIKDQIEHGLPAEIEKACDQFKKLRRPLIEAS